jgi:hypothetical protein
MNNKIYNNALNLNGYIQNQSPSTNKNNEPYYLKNDYEFNKRLAELKAQEKEIQRKDPSGVNARLQEADRLRDFESKLRAEKIENQKLYKDYLDTQKVIKVNKSFTNGNEPSEDQLIMPGYHFPSRPIATGKKASDSINWVKNNHVETLNNGYGQNPKNYYLGNTMLRHNPITEPLDNIDYNKYLTKQRVALNYHGEGGNTFSRLGNQIIA